jgi:hypothetical protein
MAYPVVTSLTLASLRYTILYCGNLISNAFGQLIAAGVLANMKGTLGHAAWRWLFFSETARCQPTAIPLTSLQSRALSPCSSPLSVGEHVS